MTRPFLTVVIPTQGRATLPRALESIRRPYSNLDVEVRIVADTHSRLLSDVESVATRFHCVYDELDAGTHAWGYPQIQRGYDTARGEYIACIGDDDVYEPGALEIICAAVMGHPKTLPHLFKVELHPSPTRGCRRPTVLWDEPRLMRGRISTQNIVAPNVRGRLGTWWDDFCFIEATVNNWAGQVEWREELIARCY